MNDINMTQERNADTRSTCNTCLHFRRKPENLSEAECLRYPPTMTILSAGQQGISTIGMYPPVKSTTPACGEYKTNLKALN